MKSNTHALEMHLRTWQCKLKTRCVNVVRLCPIRHRLHSAPACFEIKDFSESGANHTPFNRPLQRKGFIGFFDIDSLQDISREALKTHVHETCCVVRLFNECFRELIELLNATYFPSIFLKQVLICNDETLKSEWVMLELQTARDAGVKIIPLVNEQNFKIRDLVYVEWVNKGARNQGSDVILHCRC